MTELNMDEAVARENAVMRVQHASLLEGYARSTIIDVQSFAITDMQELPVEDLVPHSRDFWTPNYLAKCASFGCAFTVRAASKPLMVCGVAYDQFQVGWAWSFLAARSAPYLFALRRVAMHMLDRSPRPIRATAPRDFTLSLRWLRLLGFERYFDPAWPPGPDDLFQRRI